MALTRDQQRIIKFDVEIWDLEILYQRELNKEFEEGKHTLLLSRGIKYRIDKLRRARKMLAQATKNNLAKHASYAIELANRKEAVANVERQIAELKESLSRYIGDIQVLVAAGVEVPPSYQTQIEYCTKDIPKAETVLRAKKRALENWIMNGEQLALGISRSALPRSYDPEKDAEAIYGKLPVDDITETAKDIMSGTFDITKTAAYNKTAETKIDIRSLMRPEELEKFDSLEQSVVEVVNEPTVEELEVRQLKEMHETKYQPPTID